MKPFPVLAVLTLLTACEQAAEQPTPGIDDTPVPPTDGVCGGPGAWIITYDADGNVICTPDGW